MTTSTYRSRFATQRQMDETGPPAYGAWGPANVEAAYQCLRSLAAIREQKNCQWCSSLASTFQPIGSTYKICGQIRTLDVQRISLYCVFYAAAAWSGDVYFEFRSREYLLNVTFAGAGYQLQRYQIDIDGSTPGSIVKIKSATARLRLCHLGIYENEGLQEADTYPGQVLRPAEQLFRGLRNQINEVAQKPSAIGGWTKPAAYAITANSKPAIAQCRLYHGKQYVESKDVTNYQQEYGFLGYVGTMPDLGDLGYAAALAQSGDSYTDIFRLGNAYLGDGLLKGCSYATSAPRSVAELYLWRTNGSAKINLCCMGWWSQTGNHPDRPDIIADPSQFVAGEKILESSFVQIWEALHYNFLYGCARPVLSWCPPGGAALALTGTSVDYLWGAVPTYSYQRPWGAEWAAGKVPLTFWLSALNGSTSARTVSVTVTWGADTASDTWALAGSGSGQQYKEISLALTPPANLTPIVVSLKIGTNTTVTFSSIWGAISYPLDY